MASSSLRAGTPTESKLTGAGSTAILSSLPSAPKSFVLRSIDEFTDCKTKLGATKTADLYQDKKTGEEFVLKNKKIRRDTLGVCGRFVRRRLMNEEVAYEKLAFDLYALCGVSVPQTVLVRSEKTEMKASSSYTMSTGWGQVRCIHSRDKIGSDDVIRDQVDFPAEDHFLHLASQKLTGFQTLDDLLEIKDETPDVNERRVAALATQHIKGKPIRGLFENLAIIAFLYDYDAIGFDFNNFGLVDQGTHYQFIKIDPGETQLRSRPDGEPIETNGFTKLDLPEGNGTILAEFSMEGAEPWNIKRAFASATPAQKLAGLRIVANLTNEQITNTVLNTQGAMYIPEKKKQVYIDELIRRRNLFKAEYAVELAAVKTVTFCSRPTPAASVHAPTSSQSAEAKASAGGLFSTSLKDPLLGPSPPPEKPGCCVIL